MDVNPPDDPLEMSPPPIVNPSPASLGKERRTKSTNGLSIKLNPRPVVKKPANSGQRRHNPKKSNLVTLDSHSTDELESCDSPTTEAPPVSPAAFSDPLSPLMVFLRLPNLWPKQPSWSSARTSITFPPPKQNPTILSFFEIHVATNSSTIHFIDVPM
ncbi:hypothetical protein L1887_08606 [Cichorium endivia]|nr:hypothetical protein L1887_08606 [Cichorium endivia]